MILAIDTSSECVSIGLYEASGQAHVHAEETWVAGQQHSTQVLVEVERLLKRLKMDARGLDGVAVALGPGSFNGLRVGLSAAKGLCLALEIPILGVGTLEAWAYQYAHHGLSVRCIAEAGRGNFNTALYELKDGAWLETEAPGAATVAQIKDRINGPTFICGDIAREPIAQMLAEIADRVATPTPAGALRRCGYLAELGLKKLKEGKADDLKSLQPIYLRRPAITKSRRADALAVHSKEGENSEGGS